MSAVDVLVVSPPTPVWGAQLRILDYAPALADRGVSLTLASPPEGDFHAAWVARGLTHRSVAIPSLAGIRDPESGRRPGPRALVATTWRALRGTVALTGAVGEYDVVWSFNLRIHASTVLAARLRRVPVAIEIVDIVKPGVGRRILQASAARADATIVNSVATGAPLEGHGRDVHVIHPGVDTTRFRPGPPSSEVRRELGGDAGVLIGIVGRIDADKGIDVLVEAMGRVPTEVDVRLVVVGALGVSSASLASRLEARAAEVLGPRARFVGRRDDMPEVLRALDVLVNASPAEPFGRSVLEAQATGIPVVGTNQGGIPEFVTDGETGLLVEPGDTEGLARAITTLARDPALRTRLGVAARTHVVDGHDIVERYDRVAALFNRLAGTR